MLQRVEIRFSAFQSFDLISEIYVASEIRFGIADTVGTQENLDSGRWNQKILV